MTKNKKNDNIGDRMKSYENQTCGIKLITNLPIIARLDGKSFSKFTKGLKRPFDERLSNLMIETTKYLVRETNANCGYTQSDEITLLWYTDNRNSSIYFDGRLFKMIGDLSASASVYFNRNLHNYIPEKSDKMPRFDARVYNVPSLEEAVNSFIWRELDAIKNSISMAASAFYSPKELYKKNDSERHDMLFDKGVNWEDYPSFFKRGTYIQRKKVLKPFNLEEIEKLPPKHNARKNNSLLVERWSVDKVEAPPILKIKNKIDFIFYGKDCIL